MAHTEHTLERMWQIHDQLRIAHQAMEAAWRLTADGLYRSSRSYAKVLKAGRAVQEAAEILAEKTLMAGGDPGRVAMCPNDAFR